VNDAPPAPSAEAVSAARDQAFEEVERMADLAASYVRSIGEAAFRGDEATMVVHLKQLRLCCLAMIKTYKDCFGADGTAGI
jgi:hypothetical protein